MREEEGGVHVTYQHSERELIPNNVLRVNKCLRANQQVSETCNILQANDQIKSMFSKRSERAARNVVIAMFKQRKNLHIDTLGEDCHVNNRPRCKGKLSPYTDSQPRR